MAAIFVTAHFSAATIRGGCLIEEIRYPSTIDISHVTYLSLSIYTIDISHVITGSLVPSLPFAYLK